MDMSLAGAGTPYHAESYPDSNELFGPSSDFIDNSIEVALGVGMIATGAILFADLPELGHTVLETAPKLQELQPRDQDSQFSEVESITRQLNMQRQLGAFATNFSQDIDIAPIVAAQAEALLPDETTELPLAA